MILKKNWIMKIAALMFTLVLVTSCLVGGTFAKYVRSANGSDTARVAKFGVNIVAVGDIFSKTYAKDDNSFTLATNTVVSSNNDKLVAPGTKKDIVGFALTGTPEVAVRVSFTVDKFELSNWEIPKDRETEEYCPLIFKAGGQEYKIDGKDITSVEDLEEAVKDAIEEVTFDYPANTDLSKSTASNLTVSWEWPFHTSDANDVKDTALGDIAAENAANAGKVDVEVTMSVTQID